MKRLVLAAMMVAAAMSARADDDGGDAPDRGVARISYMNGNVSVRRGDSGELVAAVLNAPLTATDRLVTGEGSRAEVQLDSANLIRLGPSTEVRFSELTYGRDQVQIAAGAATFSVLREPSAQVEISTPSVSVRPVKRGIYRITVRPDGSSEITARSGEAEIFSPRGSEALPAGKTMLARGTASDPEFQITGTVPEDDFDRWSAGRDGQLARATSPRYVNPDVYGAEDMDGYGRWTNDPQYGNVWVPQVDPGWAPYQCGRWVWVDFYGWTWVGCESWGWAPYHYGRWYWGSYGWAWYPGPFVGRYYWRPALVGFFGWGAPGIGVGFGFGFGYVGWVPLAPFEAFHPWYGRGFGGGFRGTTVINNVNVVNNTNITNVYRNARVANGVTSMSAGNFGHAAVSNATMARASAGDLSRAGMMRGQLPVTPSRESAQFSSRPVNSQGLPRTSENTPFVSRSQPAQAARNGAVSNPGNNGAGGNGGWQRFNPSNRGAAGGVAGTGPGQGSASPGNGNSSSAGGWRRFEGGGIGSPGYQRAEPSPGSSNRPSPGYTAQPQSTQPQSAQPQSRGYSPQPQTRGYGSQQPVRISPPILQNRGGGGNSGGGGGGSRGGGGGGGSRGGGGGGSHGGGHR